MKVLLINREIYPIVSGGKEIFVYQLARGLAKRGHKIYLLSAYKDLWNLRNVEFVTVPYLDIPAFRTVSFILNTIQRIHSVVRQVDLINCHECDFNSLSAFLIKKIYKKPLVITVHRGSGRLWWPCFVSRKFFKSADRIVAVSKDIADKLRQMGFNNVCVIPAVSEIERTKYDTEILRKKFGLSTEDLVIIFVGRLEPVKDPRFLIDAINKLDSSFLEEKNIKVIIVGEGRLRESLEKRVQEYNLADHVKFIGKIPHERIQEIYEIADILVSTSKYEGSPLSVIEAFGRSIPVICPDTVGFKRLVVDGNTGLLYLPGNIEDFLLKLKKLIGNGQLRKRLGQSAFELVKNRFDLDRIINMYEKLYREISYSETENASIQR